MRHFLFLSQYAHAARNTQLRLSFAWCLLLHTILTRNDYNCAIFCSIPIRFSCIPCVSVVGCARAKKNTTSERILSSRIETFWLALCLAHIYHRQRQVLIIHKVARFSAYLFCRYFSFLSFFRTQSALRTRRSNAFWFRKKRNFYFD